MNSEQISALLVADESDTLERKETIQDQEVARAFCAFANDLPARGGGWLILGQDDDKKVKGLQGEPEKIERDLSRIARERCRPAIPVQIHTEVIEGHLLALVRVDASIARPHMRGECFVRVGSTTRNTTDAEIITMRENLRNPKLRQLQQWIAQGQTKVRFHRVRGHQPGIAFLIAANENWVTLAHNHNEKPGSQYTVPLDKLSIGFRFGEDLPILLCSDDMW